ncbi:hypothetical protein NKG94_33775 [Micromonospora sp. M12]
MALPSGGGRVPGWVRRAWSGVPPGRSSSMAAGSSRAARIERTRSCTSSGVHTGRDTQSRLAGTGCTRRLAETSTPSPPWEPQSSRVRSSSCAPPATLTSSPSAAR